MGRDGVGQHADDGVWRGGSDEGDHSPAPPQFRAVGRAGYCVCTRSALSGYGGRQGLPRVDMRCPATRYREPGFSLMRVYI